MDKDTCEKMGIPYHYFDRFHLLTVNYLMDISLSHPDSVPNSS